MSGAFVQIGQHTIPQDSIREIDLRYQQTQSEGGNQCVRVWLNTNGYTNPGMPSQPPTFLDFRGSEAQTIRRNVAKLNIGGNVTELLAADEAEDSKPATKAAGK